MHHGCRETIYDGIVSDIDEKVDGRAARSARTRELIVSALVDLLRSGATGPTAQHVADAAGVSLRSVYAHFSSTEELHRAAVDRVTPLVLAHLRPIDPTESTEVRVDVLCGQRARINEDLGSLLLAADRQAHASPDLAASRRLGRVASVQQLERIFAAELGALDAGPRQRRVACIQVLLEPASWRSLRDDQQLSVDEARIATRDAVLALLPTELA